MLNIDEAKFLFAVIRAAYTFANHLKCGLYSTGNGGLHLVRHPISTTTFVSART